MPGITSALPPALSDPVPRPGNRSEDVTAGVTDVAVSPAPRPAAQAAPGPSPALEASVRAVGAARRGAGASTGV